jgi:hypothetical protein
MEQQLRFAVRKPGIPEASPRSHGVPRRNVPGCVHVSVAGESAGYAAEEGLALAALRSNMPAGRTPLAGVSGMNSFDPAWGLLFQAPEQKTPTGPADLPVQSGFLPHIVAWGRNCTPGGTGHLPDVQVLDKDLIKPACDTRGHLFNPVLAAVPLASLHLGNGCLDPPSTARTASSARKPALKSQQFGRLFIGQPWDAEQFSGRQGCGYHDTSIDAHDVAGAGGRCRFGYRGERDMPTACPVACDSVRLHARRNGAGPSERYPTCLRHAYRASPPAQAQHVTGFDRDDSEALVPPRLAPTWSTVGPLEVVDHGLVEVAQRLLLHHLASCRQPRVFSARGRKLSALLQISRTSPAPGTPPLLLLDRQVPHIARMGAMPSQDRFLFRGRPKTVTRHMNIISKMVTFQ